MGGGSGCGGVRVFILQMGVIWLGGVGVSSFLMVPEIEYSRE